VGVHHFWGFSPAYDVQEVHERALAVVAASRAPSTSSSKATGGAAAGAAAAGDDDDAINVLLVQPGDPRTLIKTICQRLRHKRRRINVCVCVCVW
jgi:hypothetical protein